MNRRNILLMLLSWLAYAPATKAQFVCEVTLPASYENVFQQSTSNSILAFGASGRYCTAATLETADSAASPHARPAVRLVFYHSTDGGLTWNRQDPGLPMLYDNYQYVRAVDQIDAATAVAVGDSSLVVRTSDGGHTWFRQHVPRYAHLFFVNFADPDNGLIIGWNDTSSAYNLLYTTSDGGEHWKVDSVAAGVRTGRAYGNGRFRLFQVEYGRVYTTLDDFRSLDSTKPIFDSVKSKYVYGHFKLMDYCRFGAGDTMIAYGIDYLGDSTSSADSAGELIWRSTDAGQSWSEVLDTFYWNETLGGVAEISDVDQDTIVAGLGIGLNNILVSTDHGATWKIDTLLFDSSVAAIACWGIAAEPGGAFTGAFGSFTSGLIYGRPGTARIQSYSHIPYYSYLYPNPATSTVNIVSQDRLQPIGVYDVLGRELLHGRLDENGKCILNVSGLANGVYVVMLDHDGEFLPVSRIAVIGH